MKKLIASVRKTVHRAWRRRLRDRLDRLDTCRLFGLDLEIPPGVLHPVYFASSRFLGRHAMRFELRDRAIADLGTGSGVLALLAARAGGRISAFDINPNAIACALGNASRNGLADRVSVMLSDVFDGAPDGLRFDYVFTNPPFYPRDPRTALDLAFAAGAHYEFFLKLAKQIRGRLADNGTLVLVHSSDADFEPVRRMFTTRGLVQRREKHRRGIFETLTIREFQIDAPAERVDDYRR